MKLLFVVLAAICIIGVHSSPVSDVHESRGAFHEAGAGVVCASAEILQSMGWLDQNGEQSRQFRESEAAKECREITGENTCDTADRILSCLRNRGLATAVGIATLPFGGGLGNNNGGGLGGGFSPF